MPLLIISKNSERVSADFLNCPNIALVEVKLFCFSTPLICMHICRPSITTATPLGFNAYLIELATLKGKKQNKNIKLGICGEHGGDPKSINFCSITGLNYVSFSPYRVPVARLAAAQAQLKKQ